MLVLINTNKHMLIVGFVFTTNTYMLKNRNKHMMELYTYKYMLVKIIHMLVLNNRIKQSNTNKYMSVL